MKACALSTFGAPVGTTRLSVHSVVPSTGTTKPTSSSSSCSWAMSPLYSTATSTSPAASRSCPLSSAMARMCGFCRLRISAHSSSSAWSVS